MHARLGEKYERGRFYQQVILSVTDGGLAHIVQAPLYNSTARTHAVAYQKIAQQRKLRQEGLPG
jgi:hypothetical protein